MIRIERRSEPADLVSARKTGLLLARAALGAGTRVELSGYEVAKAALAEMQHRKCCYYEKVEEQPKYRDVEHYRPSLLTLYTDHVVHHVRPRISDLLAAHRESDAAGVVRMWRSLLAPARPFRALSYDALRSLVPADVCARYQLALLRPGG
jgi:hypothetical protein